MLTLSAARSLLGLLCWVIVDYTQSIAITPFYKHGSFTYHLPFNTIRGYIFPLISLMSNLEQYRKIKYLGKGSYGAALLVELKATGQKYVMKEIVIGHLSSDAQKTAKLEAEVLRQMSHSNIVQHRESFIKNDKLFIVMEYADGGDLAMFIKKRKDSHRSFSEEEVMQLFVQICLALRHVHGVASRPSQG